jgi:hypothetical protein
VSTDGHDLQAAAATTTGSAVATEVDTANDEAIDPETAGLSTQATLRFQKAKIQALNDNVNKLIQEVGIRVSHFTFWMQS